MDTPFFINGPAGVLECLASPGHSPHKAITAILCHPHPLFSGTMQNKVVTTLMQTCRDLGMDTIRFNFRGVGQSAGVYGNGDGELDDCLAIVNWVKQNKPGQALLLAGFSFGGCVALRAAALVDAIALITVAPAVAKLTSDVPTIACPWIMVQGEQDEIVSPESVYRYIKQRQEKITLLRFPQATHFFHGQLTILKQQLTQAISNVLENANSVISSTAQQ